MARSPKLITDRDAKIKSRFKFHRKKNPKWTMEAVIGEVANEFFLASITVAKILKKSSESGVPSPSTLYRKQAI